MAILTEFNKTSYRIGKLMKTNGEQTGGQSNIPPQPINDVWGIKRGGGGVH